MFTGIIQELGTVVGVKRSAGLVRLSISGPKTAARVARLESVAVNGVCLTAIHVTQHTMVFEVIQETQSGTTLGTLRSGGRVHLEPSLLVSDRLNGHLLFGHVDGLGTVVKRRELPSELVLTIRVAPTLRKYLVPKGPIAIDGVSLTVGALSPPSAFTIHLIPETLRQTTLHAKRLGDCVNIELDYFAKLMWQFLSTKMAGSGSRRKELN